MSEHEFDARVDRAIDRAVHQMMSAEPRPGLRGRVLGAIERPAQAGWGWLPGATAAALSVAALMLAVLYLRPAPSAVQPPQPPVIAQAPSGPSVPAEPQPVPEVERQSPESGAAPSGPRVERLPEPPKVGNVFGSRPDGRVTAATVSGGDASGTELPPLILSPIGTSQAPEGEAGQAAKPGAGETAKPQPARPAPQLVNIRIELTLIEEGDAAAPPKTVRMLVADQQQGRVRSGGPSNQTLNLDARPELVAGGRIRVHLTLEYRPDGNSPQMQQSLAAVLESGTPLPITQSTDPRGNRVVRAELTATIVK